MMGFRDLHGFARTHSSTAMMFSKLALNNLGISISLCNKEPVVSEFCTYKRETILKNVNSIIDCSALSSKEITIVSSVRTKEKLFLKM